MFCLEGQIVNFDISVKLYLVLQTSAGLVRLDGGIPPRQKAIPVIDQLGEI